MLLVRDAPPSEYPLFFIRVISVDVGILALASVFFLRFPIFATPKSRPHRG